MRPQNIGCQIRDKIKAAALITSDIARLMRMMKLWSNGFEFIIAESSDEAFKAWCTLTGHNEEVCENTFDEFIKWPLKLSNEEGVVTFDFNGVDELLEAGYQPYKIIFSMEF
jgi:hypothetical protein